MKTPTRIRAKKQNAGSPTNSSFAGSRPPSTRDFRDNRMSSKDIVIQGEDPADFDALVAEFDKRFRPANILEDCVVQQMVRAEWRCRRMSRVEAYILRDRTGDHTLKLAPLARYKATLRRIIRRGVRHLADVRATEAHAPHLIHGGSPTATITTRPPSRRRNQKLLV